MDSFYENREVWFFTGSQGLYGEETLRQVAEQSQRVVDALNAPNEVPLKIVWKPVLTDSDAIRRAILDADSDDRVVGIIAWMHTFSPAKMWIRGLEVLTKPLLHLTTQDNVEIPWDSIDMDFMNLNQAAHGDREFSYILSRLGIPRVTVVGHSSDAETILKVSKWVRAAAGLSAAHQLKVVRFGDNMRNVAVTEGDKTEAERKLGVSVNTWAVNDLVERVQAVSDGDVASLAKFYEDNYEVAPELKVSGGQHESLCYAARQEIAMRSFLEELDAGAFTTNFEDLGALRQLPGLAVQRLTGDGYGFGAEGDWKTAVLVRIAKVMGEGLSGGASLMEDYCYNYVKGQEMILGAHMLEVCPSLTTKRPRIEIHPLGIGNREDPVRMVFDADAGQGCVVAMADMRDRFRLTANKVEVVDAPYKMPNLPVARAIWRPAPDLYTSVESWLTSGSAHHTVLSTQVDMQTWQMFAQLAQMELAVIDENTNAGEFARQLRWEQAYFRLAEGI